VPRSMPAPTMDTITTTTSNLHQASCRAQAQGAVAEHAERVLTPIVEVEWRVVVDVNVLSVYTHSLSMLSQCECCIS
jgi:hypothetical protein